MNDSATPPTTTRRSRSRFRPEEDEAIRKAIEEHGRIAWSRIASILPNRTARQVRERWLNYLTPDVSHAPWTEEEDMELLQTVSELGRAWSLVAKKFAGRTDVTVKNRYKLLMRREETRSHPRKEKAPEPKPAPAVPASETVATEWDPSRWHLSPWDFTQIPPLRPRF